MWHVDLNVEACKNLRIFPANVDTQVFVSDVSLYNSMLLILLIGNSQKKGHGDVE
jgi:hypothetical protein